jgi:small-conductance mechanosensitive channel
VTADAVSAFRDRYRREYIPPRYRGWLHAVFTFGVGGCVLVACIAQLEQVQPLEWLTVPLAFLYANLAEYWGHRGPMHHLTRGLRLVYERHTRQHHRFFTQEAMPIDEMRDLRAVLFPPVLMIFFIAAFAFPMGLLLAWLASPNVAWLFVAISIGYFLNYEFLHLAYHLPQGHAVAHLPFIDRLQRLHRTHHDPALMTRCNFNITYPVGDALFGTLRR